ncbi:MAG: c-type cytochrome domain-containing protein [Polyangiales bacterium]
MSRLKSILVLAVSFGFTACLDFSPGIGSKPLNDEERAALKADTGTFVPVDGATRTVYFDRDIRPLIKRDATADPDARGCYPCHNGHAAKHVGLDLGGLDLSTLGSLRKGGGTSGSKVVIPGDPKNSAIVQKLKGTYPYGTRMPKSGPAFWSDDEIGLVEQWILEGAQGDDSE